MGLRNSATASVCISPHRPQAGGASVPHVRPRPWRGHTASGGRSTQPGSRSSPCAGNAGASTSARGLSGRICRRPGAALHHGLRQRLAVVAYGRAGWPSTPTTKAWATMGAQCRRASRASTSPGRAPGRTRRRLEGTLLDPPVFVLAGAIVKLLLADLLCINGSFPRRR